MFELIGEIWTWALTPIGLTTIIGGGFAAWQFWKNCRSNRLNNELTNAPEFYFVEPHQCHVFNNSDCAGGDFAPQVSIGCDSSERVYWFGLVNAGRFAAREVRIAIAKKSELVNVLNIPSDRWQTLDYWGGNNFQEVSNGEIIPLTTSVGAIELGPGDNKLYVLLDYRSDYSGIRYKRLYEWCVVENGSVGRLYRGIYQNDVKKAKEELDKDGQLSIQTQASLANLVLDSVDNFDENMFSEMGFTRSVFLREVRTIKAVSSYKVRWWIKLKIKVHRVISKNINCEDWLKDFWSHP